MGLSNLNSKKLVITILAVAGLTFAMYLDKIAGEQFIATLVMIFSTYMAIQTKAEAK